MKICSDLRAFSSSTKKLSLLFVRISSAMSETSRKGRDEGKTDSLMGKTEETLKDDIPGLS